MSRGVGIVFLLLALPAGASAQGALNDQSARRAELSSPNLVACATSRPQITANTYGPPLSKEFREAEART